MDVNFAVTTPQGWASEELGRRASGLRNPSAWATQRKPWVRAISSAIVDGDGSLRSKYVLFTGNQTSFNASYDSNTFRPTFGITGMEMDFKGTMGSTRSMTINFQCWNKTDLENLEKLYMVPGMTIIVEWGWSLTSDGRRVRPVNKFLNSPAPDDNYLSNIMKDVIANRKLYTGNYDGFVGLVTNFNYSLNADLGFDCTFEIIGPGEMFLEESAVNNSGKCKDLSNKGKSKSNLEHAFHQHYTRGKEDDYIEKENSKDGTTGMLRQVWELETREYDKNERTGFTGFTEDALDMINTARNSYEVYISWGKFVSILNGLIGKVKTENAGSAAASTQGGSKGSNVHLALGYVPVSIMPKFMSADPRICVCKLHNIDKENGKKRQEEIELPADEPPSDEGAANDTAPESKKDEGFFMGMANAAFEFVADAKEAVAETVTAVVTKGMQIVRETSMLNDEVEKMYPENGLPDIFSNKFAKDQIDIYGDQRDKENAANNKLVGSSGNNVGLLNNVFLNCAYLRDLLVSEDELSVEDVLSTLLSDLNECSGNLWNLQYAVTEEDPNKLNIYDANYTSVESRDPNKVKPYNFKINEILPLKVTVESKLVDGFREMVLYGDSKSTDNGTTNSANQGSILYADTVVDGFKKPSQSVKQCIPDPKVVAQIREDLEDDLDAAYFLLVDAVDDESTSGAKNALKQYLKFLEENGTAKNIPRNNNVLLPFSFSVEIDGFSGLIWGNAINFNYLPARYNGRIFFQITKIKHSLNSDQWTTSLETVMRLINTTQPGQASNAEQLYKASVSTPTDNDTVAPANYVELNPQPAEQPNYVRDKVKK